MALKITNECINCGACEPECPNQAIYEQGTEWSMAEGTSLKGKVKLFDGREVDADEMQEPLSDEFYFIIADKCTECKGFHEEEQCIANCPVPECLIVDPEHEEDDEILLAKQAKLHEGS
jgi:ferredoxin